MKKKVIIFDMDGVLVNTSSIAKESIFKSHPGLTEEMHEDILSGNFHEGLEKYSYLRKPETEEEKKIRQKEYSERKSKAPIFNGIRELLEKFHKLDYVIILNTSALDRNCMPILENLKIAHLFDFIATGDLSKSKIEKFKLIEDKYNAEKKDILFITDTLGDVKEADLADISTIAVTWGAHSKSFFEREKHSNLIGVVDTIEELSDFIIKN